MAKKSGIPVPLDIQNAPELMPGLGLYYEAFCRLDSCRPIGMSLGPIPWNYIDDYCDRTTVDGDQRDAMHHHVRAMDNAYLKFKEDTAPKGKK